MNKYQEIFDILLRELQEGRYPAGSVFPSEYLLADRFGVGRGTVNKAVSRLIVEGWLRRGVRGSGTRVAGIQPMIRKRIAFLGGWTHGFSAQVLLGAQRAAVLLNYELALYHPEPGEVGRTLAGFLRSNIQGVIVQEYTHLPPDFPLPVMYIDLATPDYHKDCHNIANRNYDAAYRMVGALLNAGHREIVVYANIDYQSSHRWFRVRGMLDAIRDAGIRDAEKRLFAGVEYQAFDAAPVIQRIYRRFPATTAIATVSDDQALKVLLALKKLDIQPPPVVTGFGNVPNISDVYNLPTVDQHPCRLGARAAELLINIIEGVIPPDPVMEFIDADPINLGAIPIISGQTALPR